MLGRRILRIKAFKVIYSYAVTSNMTLAQARRQFDDSLEATRDLYLYMLAIVSPLTKIAAERIDSRRQKFNPSEEDLHPNDKFATNALAALLDGDIDFQKIISKKKLSWDQYDLVLKTILDSMQEKDWFKQYMARPSRSLAQDCELFTHVFEEEFSDLDPLRELLEEKSLYWYDDLEYALTQCCRTFASLARGARWRLPELYQSDEVLRRKPGADVQSDSDFAHKLLTAAFTLYEKVFKAVQEAVPDWDSDRLFLTDIAIIDLGVAEHKTFPEIPLDVTLSEYIEISKDFCSPKSRQFVNSLMDKLIKDNI